MQLFTLVPNLRLGSSISSSLKTLEIGLSKTPNYIGKNDPLEKNIKPQRPGAVSVQITINSNPPFLSLEHVYPSSH